MSNGYATTDYWVEGRPLDEDTCKEFGCPCWVSFLFELALLKEDDAELERLKQMRAADLESLRKSRTELHERNQ